MDYPPAPCSEVRMTIEKGAEKGYGLDLDIQDAATLFVLGVHTGPFQAYHESCTLSEDQIRKLDFITMVNGVSGDAARMVEQFKTHDKLELLVRHPQEMVALIDNSDSGPLGISFVKKPVGEHLVIVQVDDGPIRDWNCRQPVNNRIQAGDRIVAVSGQGGKAWDLKTRVEKAGQFQ